MKELILVDGQEGFVDLEIVLGYTSSYMGEQKEMGFDFPRKVFIPVDKKKRLLVLIISRNNLLNEYHNLKIDGLERKRYKLREVLSKKIYEYQSDYITDRGLPKTKKAKSKMNSYIRRKLSFFTEKYRNLSIEIGNFRYSKNDIFKLTKDDVSTEFGNLCSKIPSKYKKTVIENWRDGGWYNLEISLLKISIQAIPYLEQQHQLRRIDLSDEEIVLVKVMKEAMRIRDEKVSFDGYISNWAKKLAKEVEK